MVSGFWRPAFLRESLHAGRGGTRRVIFIAKPARVWYNDPTACRMDSKEDRHE